VTHNCGVGSSQLIPLGNDFCQNNTSVVRSTPYLLIISPRLEGCGEE